MNNSLIRTIKPSAPSHRKWLQKPFFSWLLILFSTCFLLPTSCLAQKDKWSFLSSKHFDDQQRGENKIRIVFYNVENLFDPFDDSLTIDESFTPTGDHHWSYSRYLKKLDNIAKTLAATGGWELPSIVGFCEVENRMVLLHLLQKTCLKSANYQIIHRDSPDKRGIDVAAIYRPDKFKLLDFQYLPVSFPFSPTSTTREILYAKGLLPSKDTLHFFVNHWPSRRGGQKASEPRRMQAARVLQAKTDSILDASHNPSIVIMGDFNDEPIDKSLNHGLSAYHPDSTRTKPQGKLVNLMYPMMYKTGTHSYQGHWGVLDQFIISDFLLDGFPKIESAQIFDRHWLLKENAAGEAVTNRTYQGPMYKGGFSDHLPILLDILLK